MFQQLIGQTLDSYKILGVLGEGGMGAVLKGYDVTLQRDVAIKVMHAHIAKQPNFQERFLQEARTAAHLDHPSIVQVYSFGQYRSMPYIVMKFIPGDNLEKMLHDLKASGKWLLLNETIQMVRQVSLALDYAHQNGILHRDMKPSNIMIEPVPTDTLPYRPVITDLGLAKLMEGGVITQDGTSMGTPAYMSPEASLGKPTDARSDVYSLGILLFELATGQLPFPIKTLTDAIQYHTQVDPPDPLSIRADLPRELCVIILKAMAKDPAGRFQSAGDLAKALGAIKLPEQAGAAPTALESAVSLITQYQKSLVDQRGPSVLEEFKTPSNLTRDLVQILTPDKRTQAVFLKPNGLTIGRDADNDIVLDDTQASRHHARIQVDGNLVSIHDLNSTNGTYLANNRLLPGVGQPWTEDNAVRIGQTWLRLRRGVPAGATSTPDSTRPYTQLARSVAPGSGVMISVNSAQINLEPGQSTNLPITLQNQSTVVDHFKVTLTGVPENWLPEPVKEVQMMPGDQKDIFLTIRPPRTSQSRAGRHPAKLVASSQESRSQVAEVPLTLTLAPYTTFATELFPQKVRAGKLSRLTIRNQGNAQEAYTIDLSDRADELVFTPRTAQVRVPEGQVGTVDFRAQPRQRKIIGGEQSHPFAARVSPIHGEQQSLTGEIVSRALIPAWVPPVAITLCLLLFAALAGLIAINNNRNAQATQTAVSAGINTANIVAQTVSANTAIALQMANANAATQQAATQNALVQGTAAAASTQAASVIQTATAAAQNAQNAATSTALANTAATQTAEASATAQASAATATAAAIAQATSAAQTQTAAANAALLGQFTKTWLSINPNGGMTRLVIQKVNDNTVSFHGYGQCTPTECDWGVINVPFTPPTLQGKWTFSFKTTAITAAMAGDKLNVTTTDTYNPGDTRPNRTDSYVFETEDSRNNALNNYVGTWTNTDPNAGMPQLIIQKVDDLTLSFHGFGACSPTYCDWGTINVPYTTPTMQGVWTFSFKTTTITVSLSGNQLKATTFDKYNPGDGRPDRTTNYIFQR